MLDKKILDKCRKIKLVVSDVDGVLTDGGMYYSNDGEYMKKFHTRDGMGVEILLKYDIKTIIISREKSDIVKKRAKKIKIAKAYLGILEKESCLINLCKEFNVKPEEIIYIGDDVNDIELMKKVGLSAAPNDGINQVKKIADYVCKAKGGEGVLREVVELILSAR